jgi:hypothetical protein
MSAVLGRTKLPIVDVIETGMGIILPIVDGPEVGVGLGVGGFGLGGSALLAEACMAFAARIIKTRAKARNVRKIIFVCIRYLIFQNGWVAGSCRQRSNV